MPDTIVKVFLGSTRRDLDKDCRPYARDAIGQGGAFVVEMDGWTTTYGDAVDVCRQKLEKDSTHYLGLIAFRRGHVPDGHDRSVTEMEFHWAVACREKEHVAVFLPETKPAF